MIKLIVSDMDGSLLTHDKLLPPDFFEIFAQLKKQNIIFTAASGRTYLTLLKHFKDIADSMHFISDNGTNLYINNECVLRKAMPTEAWKRVANVCEGRSGVAAIINGTKGDYVLPFRHDAELEKIIDGGFAALCEIESISSIDDCVYKIGICDKNGPETGLLDAVSAVCGNELDCILSGPCYLDVMAKGANKGSALAELQKRLNILPSETMTFGDYYNDLGLFANSEHSFAMQNAPDEVKKHAAYIAQSNEAFGVTKAIQIYLNGYDE